ncbi:nuclease-related domain-containing protein [Microbacterium gilvum]|uniref:NERD domain-containing protein n=1 Tax=Microbacterium gilvum TaxID=1336204 RepID=A0ABP9AMR9_9MICO
MDTQQWLWIAAAACAVLLVLVVVLIVGMARGRSGARRRIAELEVASATRVAERDRSHEEEVSSLADAHRVQVAEISEERDREIARMQGAMADARASARASREEIAKGLRYEAISRRLILQACARLGLEGELLTNIVFEPADAQDTRRFVAQVDHVLLTDAGRVVIEHKRWQGVVFDGVLPSTVHPALGHLVDEEALVDERGQTRSFAVQLVRDPATPQLVTVRTKLGAASPSQQAREQARRLSAFVAQETGRSLWFDTVVFYSHPDADPHVRAIDGAHGGARTRVAASEGELDDALRALTERPGGADVRAENDAVREALLALGADAARFGG